MKKTFVFKSSNNSFKLLKSFLFILLIVLSASVKAQQKVIQLYTGAAPGSESWNWDEKQKDSNLIYNV